MSGAAAAASHDALALYDRMRCEGGDKVNGALDTLDAAYRLYGPKRLVVAFNGGKDATVVLHLSRASMANWIRGRSSLCRLTCLYLSPGDGRREFAGLLKFVTETVHRYDLDMHEVAGGFKCAIQTFSEGRDLLAFVMGTRRIDPHGDTLEQFSPSSADWPPFMRVNPILEWEYDDVWNFLRTYHIPYCPLYDAGYTSIGCVEDTSRNEALRVGERYRAAWELEDGMLERAGRLRKSNGSSSNKRRVNNEKPA